MKVLYFGTYREAYSRNKIMIAALRQAGATVEECHVKLWHSIEDRVQTTTGGWKKPRFWWRVLTAYLKLIHKFFKVDNFDILMVGYPGQFDVFLARVLAWLRRKPLVWDVFMSIYLVAVERHLDEKSPFTVRMLKRLEARALRLPDLLIQDTAQYVAWFEKTYGISPERFRLVPTGADDRIFKPQPNPAKKDPNTFEVLYYGTFIPNHGVMKIIQAAEYLQDTPDVVIKLIGDGPDREVAEAYACEHDLENVRFLGWMDQNELLGHIASADLCLGAFGDTPQSLMTIQNKIYECMAMGKPVLTGESPAVREKLASYVLLTCRREDPQSLAEAVRELKKAPTQRKTMAQGSKEIFQKNYSLRALGDQLVAHLKALLEGKKVKK